MLKKILIGVGVVLLCVASAVGTYLVTNHFSQKDLEQAQSYSAELQAQIDAIGNMTTCYTVRAKVEPGIQITDDMLVELSVPEKILTSDFVTNRYDITGGPPQASEDGTPNRKQEGYFAKTYIEPGTPLTFSLLMVEDIPDSVRELDITGNRWPIGLKEGDYVDFRITYALGEDFIVLPHKRVYEINNQTLKVHLTEEELHIYQAALVDWYLTSDVGTDLYFTKYVEPGVQAAATPYYTVPRNIETVCSADPNIVDRASVSFKENLYNLQIYARDGIIPDKDVESRYESRGSVIAQGREALNSAVNSDFSQWYQEYLAMKEKEKQQQQQGGDSGSLIDGSVG